MYKIFLSLRSKNEKLFNHKVSHFCVMILHKGEIIEKAVRKQRFPITLLAKRLGVSRRHVYNIFNNSKVSLDLVLKVGKIIQYDFTEELRDIARIPEEYKINQLSEPDISFETVNYWKSRYFELLQEHNILLESNKLVLEDKLELFFNQKKGSL